MTARGLALGVIGLGALEALVSSPAAASQAGGLLGSAGNGVRRFLDPGAPTFGTLTDTSSSSSGSGVATVAYGAGTGSTTGVASPIIAAAQRWLGTPYQWGGTSPAGVDCSGLVQQVLAAVGINAPRTSQAQATGGVPVAGLDAAQAGDLVFFDSDGGPNSHVGIYLGSGQMIDAPHTGATVGVHSIVGYGTLTAVRRYLPTVTAPPSAGGVWT